VSNRTEILSSDAELLSCKIQDRHFVQATQMQPALRIWRESRLSQLKCLAEEPAVDVLAFGKRPIGVPMSLQLLQAVEGHTALNGVRDDNEQTNTRVGLTVALPVNRYNSIKLNASTGISTRTGSEFSAVGVAWQYRWGAGY